MECPPCHECTERECYRGYIIDRSVTNQVVCDAAGTHIARIGPEFYAVRYVCITCKTVLKQAEPR